MPRETRNVDEDRCRGHWMCLTLSLDVFQMMMDKQWPKPPRVPTGSEHAAQ